MTYKLINKQTGEEHICQKVTIDEFDYYVSIKRYQVELGKMYYEHDNMIPIYSFTKNTLPEEYYLQQVIATNNPYINIPKVVDEVDQLSLIDYPEDWREDNGCNYPQQEWDINKSDRVAFIKGYNKSQETHPFSEEDMVKFGHWLSKNYIQHSIGCYEHITNHTICKTKDLIQIWRETYPKIIYYE